MKFKTKIPTAHTRHSFARSLRAARLRSGSVSPVIVFSLTMIVAFVALSVDVFRTVHAARAIEFAAQSSGLYAYQMIFTQDGKRRQGNPDELVLNAVQNTTGASGIAWNLAPTGPRNGTTQSPVRFDSSDINIVRNASGGEESDFSLQIRGRREGADALRMFLIPAIYAFNSWTNSPSPPGTNEASPSRISEIITQPANRIGAGPQRGSLASNAGNPFAGFATFPLAISNKQFRLLAEHSNPGASVTIGIVDSTRAPGSTTSARINGAFVNVFEAGGLQYYGSSVGAPAISQLIGTMEYFSTNPVRAVNSPAMVERGSMLAAFDAGEASFKADRAEILSSANRSISQTRYHALPVLADDPKVTQRNQVVGFARMALVKVTSDATTSDITVFAILGDSTPMLNASIGTGLAGIPVVDGRTLPTSIAPFYPRAFDPASNTLGRRMTGIVMAPAISPRQFSGAPL